jgi:leucyl-tRNA synthetase
MVEPIQKEKKYSTARRDRLIELEAEAQAIWEQSKFYESNAKEDTPNKKKYFITFPYPYMNGTLHLGHAFSMSKCEFTARYKR